MSSNRLFPLKIETVQASLMVEIKAPSSLWPLELWWIKNFKIEERGDRPTSNHSSFPSL